MQIKAMFDRFEERVMGRLDRLETRVAGLENEKLKMSFGRETSTQGVGSNEKQRLLENLEDSAIEVKNEHFYYPY